MPPNPSYIRNLNLSVLQDAPLRIWKLPSAVRLRESLSGHRAVFLKAIYTAEDVTAAAKMFEKATNSIRLYYKLHHDENQVHIENG